jgi:hypothetical protein
VRRTLAALSIVLACLLPAAALASWWAYAQATDTDVFDRTAKPLATDDAVQREVVDELVAVASARLDGVPEVGLVPGGAATVRRQLRSAAEALVRTPAYKTAWRSVQRTAHARLAARLNGDVTAPLTLDLAPVADALRTQVAAVPALAPAAASITDPDPIVLLDHSEVRSAQHATDAVRIMRGIAIPGAVLALLGVVLTAGGVGVGLLRAGVCLGVSTLLLVGADGLARNSISASGDAGDLRRAVYDIFTQPLHAWVLGGAIAAVALVVAGGAVALLSRPRPAPRPGR